jgi:hypothetical protein
MFNAELLQRPAHLRQLLLVHHFARFGRAEVMAAAIGVEAGRKAVRAKHL